jgi:predicted glycoside hydrolase/deacetylase ChbG (UPF0249 family)
MTSPLLIINADDWGWNRGATDRTVECLDASRVTSATALVYMADSDRAAAIARERDLPVGLHLNLTDPFTDPNTPPEVSATQRRVASRLAGSGLRLRRWIHDPAMRTDVERSIHHQFERFEALYGASPTHVDGHNHVHVCPTVGRSLARAGSFKVRNALNAYPSAKSPMALGRAARRRLSVGRRPTTRYFFCIAELHTRYSAEDLAAKLGLARHDSVEVMAHPGFDHEYEHLMSDRWWSLTSGLRRGSYADLQ